jgi:hypothetical protein
VANVFGKMNLLVSVDVNANDETMGLLEANYRYNPNVLIGYELYAVDCKGVKHKIAVHDCDNIELVEFVE